MIDAYLQAINVGFVAYRVALLSGSIDYHYFYSFIQDYYTDETVLFVSAAQKSEFLMTM